MQYLYIFLNTKDTKSSLLCGSLIAIFALAISVPKGSLTVRSKLSTLCSRVVPAIASQTTQNSGIVHFDADPAKAFTQDEAAWRQ
jgi:hypothetical protein